MKSNHYLKHLWERAVYQAAAIKIAQNIGKKTANWFKYAGLLFSFGIKLPLIFLYYYSFLCNFISFLFKTRIFIR